MTNEDGQHSWRENKALRGEKNKKRWQVRVNLTVGFLLADKAVPAKVNWVGVAAQLAGS